MKRFTAFALVMTLCLTLFSCGSDKEQAEQPPQTEAVTALEPDYSGATVAYLGPVGTYTHEACSVFFEGEGEYIPYDTVPDAVQALSDGATTYAVIPQENTIGGAVIDYVDTLLTYSQASVVGEIELPITQNLLTVPGAALEDIKTVYSHKQGIAQGKAWLEKNLPNAEIVEVSSTAEGARMISESGDKSQAAIASAGCAEVYALDILAPGIQENDANKTRFYVLSMGEPQTAKSDRIAFVASGSASGLPALLTAVDAAGMTLVSLHDRPQKTQLGFYNYVIECSGAEYDKFRSLAGVGSFELRFLGSFDVK